MTELTKPAFDHVALAVRSLANSRDFIEQGLRPAPVGGGDAPGFKSFQWQFTNGLKLELLEPFRQTESDFLERFVAGVGPGPHHLTFRVGDINEAAEICRRAGFPILYVRDSEPEWKEAFIHPRDALGTLIQLAAFPDHIDPVLPGRGFALDVEVEVTDLAKARHLYETVLGGSVVESSPNPTDEISLAWAGSGRIRLIPSPEGSSVGIRRLALSGGLPSSTRPGTTDSSNELRRDDLGIELRFRATS